MKIIPNERSVHLKIKNRFSSSNFPCIVLIFGVSRSGKSTMASHLINGAKSDFTNSLFKVSGSSTSCTHRINAVGPVKYKEIAAAFDIDIDEYDDDNKNRDIFIIDSEGLFSISGEVIWLKQAICSMIPLVNVSLMVSNSINTTYFNDFMNYSVLIQTFENKNIHHGFCFINNKENIDGSNILQKLSDQNKSMTKDLVHEMTIKYPEIDESIYKCFSVLSFDRHPKEYINSLDNVARFIIDICLSKGTKISGSLLANSFERFANDTDDIYNNLTSKEMNDNMIQTFKEVINNEMKGLIEKQEKYIQKYLKSLFALIPFQNSEDLDINEAISKIERNNSFDEIIDNAINEMIQDTIDLYPDIKSFCT